MVEQWLCFKLGCSYGLVNIFNSKTKILTIPEQIQLCDIILSALASRILSKVITLTRSNSLSAIFSYVHFILTTGQKHWHSSIFWHGRFCSLFKFEGR